MGVTWRLWNIREGGERLKVGTRKCEMSGRTSMLVGEGF